MAEAGHAAGDVFIDQNGDFNLNGARFLNDADTDIAGQLETVLGGSSAGQKVVGGVIANSSGGLTSINTGLSGIIAANANPISTANSTAAGIPGYLKVGFATNSGTLEILAIKQGATAQDPVVATSTAVSISWSALGYA